MRDPVVLDWIVGGINYFMCHDLDNSSLTWTILVYSRANKRYLVITRRAFAQLGPTLYPTNFIRKSALRLLHRVVIIVKIRPLKFAERRGCMENTSMSIQVHWRLAVKHESLL
jgi:hypothetical protein